MTIDPLGLSADAIARQTLAAPLLVLFAGVVSSFGPCVAPRFVALAACTAQSGRPRLLLATFVAGLVCAYASFGVAASLLGSTRAYSSLVYLVVSAGLGTGGLLTILRAQHDHRIAPSERRATQSLGGVFLLGGSFAFVISPCCTPFVALILGYTSVTGRPLYGAALLAAFALGHAVPLFVCGAVSARLAEGLRRMALSQAVAVTSGTLMVGLCGYYALLV